MGLQIKEIHPLFQFTQKDVEKILQKYNRDIDSAYEDVVTIKKWLLTQKHLPLHPSDREIFATLIYSKFSVERVKQKIDMKYTIRSLIPEYLENRLPSSEVMQKVRRSFYFVPLPNLYRGNRIFVHKPILPNELLFTSHTLVTAALFYFELKVLYDISESEEAIFDFENFNLALLSRMSPMDVKKGYTLFEKSCSNRVAAIYFLNTPPVANVFVTLILEVLSEKFKKRVHFLKNQEELLEYFPKSILPKDYGGEEKSLEELNEMCIKMVDEQEEHFKIISKAKINESLRTQKLPNDEILGFHGNFRKLNVD